MEQHNGQEAPRLRVIILCSPCMGHLIPLVELARRLVADHGLSATLLFATATPTPSEEYLAVAAVAPDGVDLVAIPGPPADALPPSATVRERIAHAVASSVPRAEQLVRSLAAASLVVDMGFVGTTRGLAAELGVPVYVYFPSNLTVLSLLLHLPELDAAVAGEYRDMTEPIRLPGCMPILASDLPSPMLADRSSELYAKFLHGVKEYMKTDGFIVNSFPELEPEVVASINAMKQPNHLSVYAVGPVVWNRPAAADKEHECMRWLDRQPRGSVVYVSLGSGGTLTWQQTAELALGLEMSQQRFIWVVKRPDDSPFGCGSSFFGSQKEGVDEEEATFDFLPEGFVERTRGVGLLVLSWAPQAAVLSHPSIGCFVTHCGWNSVLESFLNCIPLIAWPLYAEQKINAAMLEGELGVATRVKLTDGGLVTKEEVVRAIKCATKDGDGETMKNKMQKLKDMALRALSSEGSSVHAIAQLSNLRKPST
ncbi:hypothetical protein EJB05_32964, partial [Eragrostis curvula]